MRQESEDLGRRVDLNLLVVFDAVYRTRNLTWAGRDMGLSQPAMSHALSRLRWILKDPLFIRMPHGMQPTALADHVAPAIAAGLATIRAGLHGETFDPSTSTRTFTIAMTDLGEAAHLPLILRGLREAPNIRIRTVDMPSEQRPGALADGRVDLALGNLPGEGAIHSALIGEHGYKTIARLDHPTIRSKMTLARFRKAKHALVTSTGGSRHGEVVEAALRSPGVNAEIALQVSSFYPIAAIVTRSDLIATIPQGIANAMAGSAPIRVFAPPVALPRARIHLHWHARSHRDPGNAWLRELYLRQTRPLYDER